MKPTRRDVTRTIALGAVATACAPSLPPGAIVNDITELNPIRVARIATPRSVEDLAALVAAHSGSISIGGGRFSQGGQTACDGALFIDMRALNHIGAVEQAHRLINVGAGATWREIQEAIDPSDLSIRIMQSFSNFTVGGSLGVNCHGDYVGLGPLVDSVRAFRIVMADGSVRTASRTENRDLFATAIGGYGGIGVIADATLELTANTRLERTTHRMSVEEYPAWHLDHVLGRPDAVLHHAVIYPRAYQNIIAELSVLTDKPTTISDRLSPRGEPTALERSMLSIVTHAPFGDALHEAYDPLIGAEPEVVWRNYEAAGDVYSFEPTSRAHTTYALQEYFIPISAFTQFVPLMAEILNAARANVLNVAIRHTRADTKPCSLGRAGMSILSYFTMRKARPKPRKRRWANGRVSL